jgi:hypothetical protein
MVYSYFVGSLVVLNNAVTFLFDDIVVRNTHDADIVLLYINPLPNQCPEF